MTQFFKLKIGISI